MMDEQPPSSDGQNQTKDALENSVAIQNEGTTHDQVKPQSVKPQPKTREYPSICSLLLKRFLRARIRRKVRKHKDPPKWTDHVMAWATVVMAAATICIGLLAYLQWRDSGKLNQAATDSATAAKGFSDAARGINTKMGQAEQDFSTIAGSTQKAIEGSERDLRTMADSSKSSIQATQDALRLEQRAWVGVRINPIEGPRPLTPPSLGIVDLALYVDFTNTGRTPALNVKIRDVMQELPSCPARDTRLEFTRVASQATAVLPPGGFG